MARVKPPVRKGAAGKRPGATGGKTVPSKRPAKGPTRKGIKKSNRNKPRRGGNGSAAIQEIIRYQTSTELLIPKLPFARLVREILSDKAGVGNRYRIQGLALHALQEAAESCVVTEFELSNLAAIHAKRVTLQDKDMKLVQAMRKGMMGYSKIGE